MLNFEKDVKAIVEEVLSLVKPDEDLKNELSSFIIPKGKLKLLAIGKAAYPMAKIAKEVLGEEISEGLVITKYGHSLGEITGIEIMEAAHPIPDENSILATKKAISLVEDMGEDDKLLFLVSGGGSSLFELPYISLGRLGELTDKLLRSGASISEINTIRKHLSRVKGGRFADICAPAKIKSIILSDVLGDDLSVIASGPAYPDISTSSQAINLLKKYDISISDREKEVLRIETPKSLDNVETKIISSVKTLCRATVEKIEKLGYRVVLLSDEVSCEAKELASLLSSIAKTHKDSTEKLAFVCGGETVVHVKGSGKGGRNQEIALAAAIGIKGLDNIAIFSLASDGTDGPTDAAGGFVTGSTYNDIERCSGHKPEFYLENNDAYHALACADALIHTGPTGTNINDVTVLLIRKK